MTKKKNTKLLNVALIIYIIVVLVYGVLFLLAPHFMVKVSGGEPVASNWLRWPGGVLIALGVGTIMVWRNPLKQYAFVLTITLGSLLAGLALLFSLLFEMKMGETWFTALPVIILLMLAAILWSGSRQAKDVLCPKEEE